ncbi:MAG: S8 family serine peptidase, partial [Bacteroidaceae bacterium]|nr:S8 family serine peptidase [Bacteroidaceae bacterium]
AESKSFTPADKTDYALFNPDTGADCVFTISPMALSENGRPEIYIMSQVDNLSDSRKLAIIIEGDPGDEVHAWNVGGYDFVSGNLRGFTDGDNHCTVGELGGTPRNVISVGSYNSRSSYAPWWVEPGYALDYSSVLDLEIGKASFFSSLGPTADGRIKPDVAAPGALIISAVNKKYYQFDPDVTAARFLDDTTGEYYYYDVDVGTSMSAPMVTGTIATWLQARPNLTPDEARQVIIASAKHDKYAPEEPNNITGYGKIAASAGLTEVLRLNDLDGIEGYGATDDTPKVWLDATTRALNIVTPSAASLTITSLSGTRLLVRTLVPGLTVIDTASLPSGIHAVALATSRGAVTSLISF